MTIATLGLARMSRYFLVLPKLRPPISIAAASAETLKPSGTTCGCPPESAVAIRARRWLRRYSSSFSLKAAIPVSLLLEQPFGENDLDDLLHSFLPGPVALELDRKRNPTGRLGTRLNHTLQTRAMGLGAGAANRVDDRINIVALAHGVDRGKRHADLGPEGADDELAPARRANRIEEIRVFPGVGRGSVDGRVVREHLGQGRECRLAAARPDVDGRVHDRQAKQLCDLGRRNDVLEQQVAIHRTDTHELARRGSRSRQGP